MEIVICVIVGIISFFVLLAIVYKLRAGSKNKTEITETTTTSVSNENAKIDYTYYVKKKSYLTDCEKEFFRVIKSIVYPNYIVYPQVPLSQIIEKDSTDRYQNELYRIIDFCIFSKDFEPLVCIEINDETHHQKNRYVRDQKVKNILNQADLPIVTLWTSFGVKTEYIKERLRKYLKI